MLATLHGAPHIPGCGLRVPTGNFFPPSARETPIYLRVSAADLIVYEASGVLAAHCVADFAPAGGIAAPSTILGCGEYSRAFVRGFAVAAWQKIISRHGTLTRTPSSEAAGGAHDLESPLASGFIPYCGSAPTPGALHWNLDPILIAALLVLAVAHLSFAHSLGLAKRDAAACAFGWLMLSLAFISPLCNLSVALFSARVSQHMAIVLLAAPMIARGRVFVPAAWRLSTSFAWTAAMAFAAIFWIWHSPAFYDETLRSNIVYWLMHVTTVAAALALWIAVFSSSGPLAFLLLFVSGLQMSLLGALLTFAAAPVFSVHEFTTAAWGLTWLQDQQLGGLVMWVPAGLLLTAYSGLAFGAALRLDAPVASATEGKAA
jgi:putative membrane protein